MSADGGRRVILVMGSHDEETDVVHRRRQGRFVARRSKEDGRRATSGDRVPRRSLGGQRSYAEAEPLEFDIDDPLSDLSDVARNLVLGAKRIILKGGLGALTLERAAEESGENKAMIGYYFGNKAGLLAAVLDSVIHDEYVASRTRLTDDEPVGRAAQIVQEMQRLDAYQDEMRVFFEMLPYALRHEGLHQRLKKLYSWYYEVKRQWLPNCYSHEESENPMLQGLTDLLGAIIDGLAIQRAIGREGYDLTKTYDALELLLSESLPHILDQRDA